MTRPGPASAVVTQPFNPERVEEIREWQRGVSRAAEDSAGFRGIEKAPATGGGDWTVRYDFDSSAQLAAWLRSEAWANDLKEGRDLFEAAPRQHIRIDGDWKDFETVVISHPVDPGREDEFLDWQRRLADCECDFPGFRGCELVPPVKGEQNSWSTIIRFDTEKNLDTWLESPERLALLAEGHDFQGFVVRREPPSPFSSQFWSSPGGTGLWSSWKGALRAIWKGEWMEMLLVLMALYPIVVLLTLGINAVWEGGALWIKLLLGNVVSVALLGVLTLPPIHWFMRQWRGSDRSRGWAHDVAGAAVAVAFVAFVAVVFWHTTT